MFTRIASLGLAATVLADKVEPTPDNTLIGSINSIMDGTVTVLDREGKKLTTFKVGKDLEVVYNGRKGELKDLKKDLPVTVTFKTDGDNVLRAVKIESDNRKPGR
jgi:hypothetical protein